MSGRNRLETVSLCAQQPRKNGGPLRARPGWVRRHGAWRGGVRRVGVHTRPRRAAAPARRLAPAPRDACRGTDPRGHVAFIFYSLNL